MVFMIRRVDTTSKQHTNLRQFILFWLPCICHFESRVCVRAGFVSQWAESLGPPPGPACSDSRRPPVSEHRRSQSSQTVTSDIPSSWMLSAFLHAQYRPIFHPYADKCQAHCINASL
jgi:hypothetical protein